jgi:hypothetical protein
MRLDNCELRAQFTGRLINRLTRGEAESMVQAGTARVPCPFATSVATEMLEGDYPFAAIPFIGGSITDGSITGRLRRP